jgi:hypothetical protein
MKVESHADAAVAVIKYVRAQKLTPPEQIMVLSTAADMLENELAEASTSMLLQQALASES